MEIIGFIIAILAGVWVYKDAERRYLAKSSAPGYWALGTILLLIIFLPLYLIRRPKEKRNVEPQESFSDNDEKKLESSNFCTQCGCKLENDNNFCPNCGNNIGTLNVENEKRQKQTIEENLTKQQQAEKEERMRIEARIKTKNELNQENKKVKAPIWKKWWFWVIAVFVFFAIIGAFTDSPEKERVEKVEEATEEEIQKETIEEKKSDKATLGEKNAVKSALNYLSFAPFSYSGLVSQLEFEGYTREEAVYGVNQCGADWNKQAALSAKHYLSFMSFSREGLIAQLEFEGFTRQQAEYGVQAVGY
jgi:hypothetical protein